jgi:hypothetical protein
MVVPYPAWMLQRLEAVIERCFASEPGRRAVEGLLAGFDRGPELLSLSSQLDGCSIRKQGALLDSANR